MFLGGLCVSMHLGFLGKFRCPVEYERLQLGEERICGTVEHVPASRDKAISLGVHVSYTRGCVYQKIVISRTRDLK